MPYFFPPAIAAMTTLTLAMTELFQRVPHETRPEALGLMAFLAVLPLPFIKGNPFKATRENAIMTLDREEGKNNRPFRMLEKGVGDNPDEADKAKWQRYMSSTLRDQITNTKVIRPTLRVNDLIVGATMALAVTAASTTITAGEDRMARLSELWNFTAPVPPVPPPNVEAWIQPPAGIAGLEAVNLSDMDEMRDAPIEISDVHEGGTLHFSVIGSNPQVTVNGEILPIEKEISNRSSDSVTYLYAETTFDIGDYQITVENGPTWSIEVSDDMPPEIQVTNAGIDPETGRLSLSCIANDDFGITGGQLALGVPDAHPEAKPPAQAMLPRIPVPGYDLCAE